MRTVPSLCGCAAIRASGGHVTRVGSGGSFGAAGRLTLTRGIALGSRPIYTTSRASGSTAQVADSVTLAHRSGRLELLWQDWKSRSSRLLVTGGSPLNVGPPGRPHTSRLEPVYAST